MLKNAIVFFGLLGLAFSILFVSILRSASIKYNVEPHLINGDSAVVLGENVTIDYTLPNPGSVLPDSPFWPLKAARDKFWQVITTNPGREADLLLLLANKRLVSAKILIEQGKIEDGYSTLTKAGKYFLEAWDKEQENRLEGVNTDEFLQNLNLSSLKHYEIMQNLAPLIPEDLRPGVVQLQGNVMEVYKLTSDVLKQRGVTPPKNPFEWE